MTNPLQNDLDHIMSHTKGLWEDLRGKRIFITGGTGFFGCWLLESFIRANDELGLKAEAVVLTRFPETFAKKVPHLAQHSAIKIHKGDVRDFKFPGGNFSHVIHAATEASAKLNAENPLLMFDTIVEGTRRVLEFVAQSGANKVLFVSSGAVYGRQPPALFSVSEDYLGAPAPFLPDSAYGEGKRVAEFLCAAYACQTGIESKIARCFAFVGPGLPLDSHFAIGNFIQEALEGGPIKIKGDGTSLRTYLYAADLAIWLWTILMRGRSCFPYNVGSEETHSITEIARKVAELCGDIPVIINCPPCPGALPQRYVPNVARAADELGMKSWIPLDLAIRRTVNWQRTCLSPCQRVKQSSGQTVGESIKKW